MPGTDDVPSPPEVLAERVRRVLNAAQRGRTAQQMADLLGRYQPRKTLGRRSWYDWQGKPDSLSSLALLAAIELGGEAAIRALMGETPPPKAWADEVRRLAQRVDRIEASQAASGPPRGDELDRVRQQLRQLQDAFAEREEVRLRDVERSSAELLALMIDTMSRRGIDYREALSLREEPPADRLGRLERQIRIIGQQLRTIREKQQELGVAADDDETAGRAG